MTVAFGAFEIPDDETMIGFVTVRRTADGTLTAEQHLVERPEDSPVSPSEFAGVLKVLADHIEVDDIDISMLMESD